MFSPASEQSLQAPAVKQEALRFAAVLEYKASLLGLDKPVSSNVSVWSRSSRLAPGGA